MALGFKGPEKVKWLGVMIGLFTLSVWVVTKKNSNALNEVENPPVEVQHLESQVRMDRERKIEDEVEKLEIKLEKLKVELRESRVLSQRRRELRELQRELHTQRRVIRRQLHELRIAPEKDWEHLADHIEAELQKTRELME